MIGSEGVFNIESTNGTVRVINFWFTTCGPCREELPHFDQLAKEYGDSVTMIAICANYDADIAPDFVAEYFSDYSMLFGLDNANESYYTKLGGKGTYPMTLVLDANGVVVERFPNPASYEALKAAIEKAMQ